MAAQTSLRALLGVAVAGCLGGCLDGEAGQFGAPQALWGLVGTLLYGLILRSAWQARRAALAKVVEKPLQGRLGAALSWRRALCRALLLCTALAAAVVALALPRWGHRWEPMRRHGVDVVVAVDVSASMLVQDVQSHGKLSRLEQAKRNIIDLLRIMNDDRVGLVAFAGAAFVACPLTLDHRAAALFLDDIDTDVIGAKGTAIGAGIRMALEAMEGAEHSAQAIILLTDGEDHGGDALVAAGEAKARHVPIFTVGIGRDEGAPIPLPEGGFRRDARGNLVLSRLDVVTLQKIAELTGGHYTRSLSGEVDLETLYRRGIRAMLPTQLHAGTRRQRHVERCEYFIAVAAAALALEALLAERPLGLRLRPRRRAAGGAADA